jgi:hypothetical protein
VHTCCFSYQVTYFVKGTSFKSLARMLAIILVCVRGIFETWSPLFDVKITTQISQSKSQAEVGNSSRCFYLRTKLKKLKKLKKGKKKKKKRRKEKKRKREINFT